MAILRMTWVSLWEPCRSVFSIVQALPGIFFFIVLQSKILYNLVAGQLPTYICPFLNCLLSLYTDSIFPLFLCPSQPNSCRVQLPCDFSMWLLILILEAPLTSSPQLHRLAPKEFPHFILLLKVKP